MENPRWLLDFSVLSDKCRLLIWWDKLFLGCIVDALTMEKKKKIKNVSSTWDILFIISNDQGTHITKQVIQGLTKTSQTS